mmetsp:Transcript_46407/g.107155  ORF Transcript_46407/g.107155 Transcript_46407/m.107155 type:complete len:212 (+) Transcript_46407:43-678(+)
MEDHGSSWGGDLYTFLGEESKPGQPDRPGLAQRPGRQQCEAAPGGALVRPLIAQEHTCGMRDLHAFLNEDEIGPAARPQRAHASSGRQWQLRGSISSAWYRWVASRRTRDTSSEELEASTCDYQQMADAPMRGGDRSTASSGAGNASQRSRSVPAPLPPSKDWEDELSEVAYSSQPEEMLWMSTMGFGLPGHDPWTLAVMNSSLTASSPKL